MVDTRHLLNRLDETPGGPVTEDELECLMLWARDDHRQVAQIVSACQLDMARLRHMYVVVEQRCRREAAPGAAILLALREMQPVVSARPAPELPSNPAPFLHPLSTMTPADPPSEPPESVEPEPIELQETPLDAARRFVSEWLSVPLEFVGGVTEARVVRILSRALCPAPADVLLADVAALALMCHLIERRRDTNMARCMDLADLTALGALVEASAGRLHRMRVAATRPEVRALLNPEDLPDFTAFVSLFSDLESIADMSGADSHALAAHIRADLETLRQVDVEVKQAAAALVSVAQDLSLPRDVAMRFWGTQIVLGTTRLPVDDLPLAPEETVRIGMLSNMLLGAPNPPARAALMESVLTHHRKDAAFIEGLALLLGRTGDNEARRLLRASLGLPETATCDGPATEAAIKRDDPAAACVALRDLPDHHSAKVLLYCRTAWMLWKAGNTRDAEGLATRAMRIAPREALTLQTLARLRLEMGQLPAARMLLESALRAAPDDLVTPRMIAELRTKESLAQVAARR